MNAMNPYIYVYTIIHINVFIARIGAMVYIHNVLSHTSLFFFWVIIIDDPLSLEE